MIVRTLNNKLFAGMGEGKPVGYIGEVETVSHADGSFTEVVHTIHDAQNYRDGRRYQHVRTRWGEYVETLSRRGEDVFFLAKVA